MTHASIPNEPVREDIFSSRLMFTASARQGLRRLLLAAAKNPAQSTHVLIPSYIGITDREGSGVLDPITEAGWSFDFYPLNADLGPAADLGGVLDQHPGAALLLIHYFGWPATGLAQLAERCAREGRLLIEDCAHVLHQSAPTPASLGYSGQGAIWSVHKTLPVETGGIAWWQADPNLPLDAAEQMDYGVLAALNRIDLAAVADQRRRNFDQLYARLASSGCELRWSAGSHVPLNFPLLVPEGVDRFDLYNRLREQGLGVIALYYRLVEEIDLDAFPHVAEISQRILNLPLHQDLDADAIDQIARTFLETLG